MFSIFADFSSSSTCALSEFDHNVCHLESSSTADHSEAAGTSEHHGCHAGHTHAMVSFSEKSYPTNASSYFLISFIDFDSQFPSSYIEKAIRPPISA